MTVDSAELRITAEEAATEAGELVIRKWSEPREIRSKRFRDWVTDADLAAQELITSRILSRFPLHGFITEEDAPDLASAGDVVWIIDPLDGTTNYSRKHPIFCVSIAAAIAGANGSLNVVAGAIYDPIRKELFSAATGHGSTLNDAPIAVSPTGSLDASIIGLDWSRGQYKRSAILKTLELTASKVHTIRAIGSAALALAWVACGRLEVYFNLGMGSWDVAAASVIIQEAGGFVSNHKGTVWSPDHSTCVASNGKIHQLFLETSRLAEWLDAPS
ncbi:MAG TPA: inositol monophosphatase family protein [candidate division Zixibacteria bacterium]|nr:inositol monophosphatase family protein [candidate division Zixibacteria bacterium]